MLSGFSIPVISEAGLKTAASLLRIEQDLLFGGSRLDVAKSIESCDVTACPGSGKTTLLVAKLAMLASNWKNQTCGMCVLSHTNVARTEIERSLGATSSGRSLFSYPHFVGTIHGFVNEFLAFPWLRSHGYPIKLIDNEIVLKRRWRALKPNTRYALEQNRYGPQHMMIKFADFGVGVLRSGKGTLGSDTPTYQDIKRICRVSTIKGYFCHDEMFIWANELLKIGGVAESLRRRFPLVFIDEAQDNSEEQSALLQRVFLTGDEPVICQRFGDGNQAIFDSVQTQDAETNPFPNQSISIELANSHRFGQSVANLANPLAAVPLVSGLKGDGPRRVLSSGRAQGPHTIFLIDQHHTHRVLGSYGDLLLRTFSQEELSQGSFFAVGQIHRPGSNEEDHKYPHHVPHYWPEYNPSFSKSGATPASFVEHISLGVARGELEGECSFAVEKIAQGFIRLACEGKPSLSMRRYSHRQVLELLEHSPDARSRYLDFIVTFALEREPLTEDAWNSNWHDVVKEIAENIVRTSLNGPAVEALLSWREAPPAPSQSGVASISSDNIYQYPEHEPIVKINLGSIHSVKGQTHTATLILETFWKAHCLEKLMPWILGERVGWKRRDGIEQLKRLKLHFVAMTRPSHLLCLAIKRTTLEDREGNLTPTKVQTLKRRGWRIEDLTLQMPLFERRP